MRHPDLFNFLNSEIERFVPGCIAETARVTNQRMQEAVRVTALHIPLHAFRTQLSLVEREIVPWLKPNHLLILDQKFNAALLSAKAAMSFNAAVRFAQTRPTALRIKLEMRAVLLNQLVERFRNLSHGLSREYASQNFALSERQDFSPAGRANQLVVLNRVGHPVIKTDFIQDFPQILDVHQARILFAATATARLPSLLARPTVKVDTHLGRPLEYVEELPKRQIKQCKNHRDFMSEREKSVKLSIHPKRTYGEHEAGHTDGE